MALVLKDRVKETTSSSGTGSVTLAGAVQGYQGFSAIGDGNTTYYCIAGVAEWEVGVGTYSAGVLSRDTVLGSSANGDKVSFSSGIKDVFCTFSAAKVVNTDIYPVTGAYNTSSPNSTVNVASFTSNVASTNGDIALVPKGTGAILGQVPTATVAGGDKRGTYAVDWQTHRTSANQVASGSYATISGGYRNRASGTRATVGGGTINSATGTDAVVAGGSGGQATGEKSFVGGGSSNAATAIGAVACGGELAVASGQYSVVGGGSNSTATANFAVAGGGYYAIASGVYSVSAGGYVNTASGQYASVGGGYQCSATADYAAVAGGLLSEATGVFAFAAGGNNVASAQGASAPGGSGNTASGEVSFVVGGGNLADGRASAVIGAVAGTTRGIAGYIVTSASDYPIVNNKNGVSQTGLLIVAGQTTDATSRVLRSNTSVAGTANQLILANNAAVYFRGTVIANVTGGGNTKSWTFDGQIKRGANAAATTLTGSTVTSPYGDAGASTWTVALSADTTNGGLAVTVTGQASTTIRWVCRLETTEVTY